MQALLQVVRLLRIMLRFVTTRFIGVLLLVAIAAMAIPTKPQQQRLNTVRPLVPSQLLIRKQLWAVRYYKWDELPIEHRFPAFTDHHNRTIYLMLGTGLSLECANLYHEIAHAITGPDYSDTLKFGHDYIAETSPEMVKVYFRDNPQLLRYTESACAHFTDENDDRSPR